MGDGRGKDAGSVQWRNFPLSWKYSFLFLCVSFVVWDVSLSTRGHGTVVITPFRRYLVTGDRFQYGFNDTTFQAACRNIRSEIAVIETNAEFQEIGKGYRNSLLYLLYGRMHIFLKIRDSQSDARFYWAAEEVGANNWHPDEPNQSGQCGVDCWRVSMEYGYGWSQTYLFDNCCTVSFSGLCVQDNDDCARGNPCVANADCVRGAWSHRCQCLPGYNQAWDWCEDVDECLEPDLNPCPNNSSCVNTVGNYTCHCDAGFTITNGLCQDIDECENATLVDCPEHSTCVNLEGNYQCVCDRGYKEQTDLCIDIDECQTSNLFACPEHSMCVNSEGNYTCDCDLGYTKQDSLCIDINECENTTLYDCPVHSTCVNQEGNYTCECNLGYTQQGDLCVDVDECLEPDLYPCPDKSSCLNTDGNYTCRCVAGFTEINGLCEDIDECEDSTLFNCPEHSTCVNLDGNYTCDCDFGYTQQGDLCHDVDECAKSTLFKCPKLSRCNNTDGGYTCICQDGYFTNESGLCEEVDKVGFKLRTCSCKCPKRVIQLSKNLSNIMNNSETIKKISGTIQKELQVNRTNLTTAVRRKTSAADERGSSASFGVIALALLGFKLLLISFGDTVVVVLYIKRKVVNVFCPRAGLQDEVADRTGGQNIELDPATLQIESADGMDLEERSYDESEL